MGPDGRHHGGPFTLHVSPKMRVEDLRLVIRVGGARGQAERLHSPIQHAHLPKGASAYRTGAWRHCRSSCAVLPCRTRAASSLPCRSYRMLASTWWMRSGRWSSEWLRSIWAVPRVACPDNAHSLTHVKWLLCRYGVAYWHAKFPEWPLKIRKCECGPGRQGWLLASALPS